MENRSSPSPRFGTSSGRPTRRRNGARRSSFKASRERQLFHRSTLSFQKIAGETTGHPVAGFQRIDQAGYKLPIDERVLADADTLMVFGLDHILSEQEAAPEEMAAICEWLKRDGSCSACTPSRRRLHQRHEATPDGISAPWRSARASSAAVRTVYALLNQGAWRSREQHLWPSASGCEKYKGNCAAHGLP